MASFFDSAALTPHGFCLLWNPALLWLHGLSDVVIGVAYFSIPVALVVLVRRRGDVAFGWMVGLFASFILACGATHFMAVLTLFVPAYWLEGVLKAATAILSVITACLLWPLIPRALRLPSPACMQRTIDQLQQTESRLTDANQALATALDEVAQSELRFRRLTESVSDLVTCIGPDLRRTYASPSSMNLLGYTPEEMIAAPPEAHIHPDDWPRVRQVLQKLLRGENNDAIQFRICRKDGQYLWIEAIGGLMPGTDNIRISIRDVSSRREAQDRLVAANAELEEMAWLDGLTSLANRRRFDEALTSAFRRCTRGNTPLSLILIDVDRFKSFNDIYGHPAGDACLRAIASVVGRMARRPHDLAARYGGEEFALVLPDMPAADAVGLAERIRAAISRLRIVHQASPSGVVTASLGVATTRPSQDSGDAADLLKQADLLLYDAKAQGRDSVCAAPPKAATLIDLPRRARPSSSA